MKFQLVIQFQAQQIASFDALIQTEDLLLAALEPKHIVDGHDFGSGEANIFVLTDDPQSAFELISNALGADGIAKIKAAFRRTDGSEYEWIHPANEDSQFRVV